MSPVIASTPLFGRSSSVDGRADCSTYRLYLLSCSDLSVTRRNVLLPARSAASTVRAESRDRLTLLSRRPLNFFSYRNLA